MTDATRRLTEIKFEHEGAHVALVSKLQGGPANGVTTLITKATGAVTEEEISKATEVTVTMNIVDFLCKFFSLWYDDALVLAMAMGYDVGDAGYSFEESAKDYNNYLQERVDAIKIMKSVVLDKPLEEIKKSVAELPASDLLAVLKAQEQFETTLETSVAKAAELRKSIN